MDRQDVWFQLKYNNKVYNINLYEVVSAVKFAEEQYWIPALTETWWNKLLKRYPEFNGEPVYNKDDVIFLTGEVTKLDEENYNDEEMFYFFTSINKDDAVIGLHEILEMLYYAETEHYIPSIKYDFWYHISRIYKAYFVAGYEEVLCVNSKLKKTGKSTI